MSKVGQCSCGPEDRPRRVLMVRRLHPAVTMQTLLQTFGVYGSITGCKVFTHKSGRSAGCASLEFSTHQAACAALKGLQGTLLHGKHVMLQWFDQSLSSAGSPSRTPGQRAELAVSSLSDGGSTTTLTGRQLAGTSLHACQTRSTAVSCPGLSPFGMLTSAAAPQNPFCNGTAAMAAAAAAAAVAAQQQQLQQHPREQAAAATAAALLASGSQHQLPPLVVQQLQRQVSAPLGPFNQLSPTGMHVPASPLTPATCSGAGWEALLSPPHQRTVVQQPFASQQQQQQRESASSSTGGGSLDAQQQQWGAGATTSAAMAAAAVAAAKLSAAMTTGSTSNAGQDNSQLAASLQQLANMQQQAALAYAAAWQNQQQAMLQHQLSGQLASPVLYHGHLPAQQPQLHLLGARSMPSELGSSGLTAEALLQHMPSGHMAHQQEQQQQGLDAAYTSSAASAASLLAGTGASTQTNILLARHSSPQRAPAAAADSSSSTSGGGGIDSSPCRGSSTDQSAALTASARRSSTGTLQSSGSTAAGGSKAAAHDVLPSHARKQLLWDGQSQHSESRAAVTTTHGSLSGNSPSGKLAAAAASSGGGGSSKSVPPSPGVQQGGNSSTEDPARSAGRQSSHQLLQPLLRGYSTSDDTANVAPDVNLLAALAATRQQQQQGAANACYPLSPTWTGAHEQSFGAAQVTPDLIAAMQPQLMECTQSSSGSQPVRHSPSAASLLAQQQQQLMLAAAAGSGFSAPGLGSPHNLQQQQSRHMARASDSQLLSAGQSARSLPPGMLLTSPSLPGPSAVAAALDAMGMAAAQGWQEQHEAGGDGNVGSPSIPASEAFKHKHKMHLQLPNDAASTPLTSSMTGGPGDGVDQLITTEVLPDSPVAHVMNSHCAAAGQQHPATMLHTVKVGTSNPMAMGDGSGGGASSGSTSAWADWSASMAALLSPMHVSSLAGRRFADLITLQHGIGQQPSEAGLCSSSGSSSVGARLQQSTPGAYESSAMLHTGGLKMGSTSSQAAWLLQQSRSEQQQQDAANRQACLLTGAGSDSMHNLTGVADDGASGMDSGAAAVIGKTRHNSLCLDSHPGLLTLSHMVQEAQRASGMPSPRGLNLHQQQQRQQATAAHRGLPGDADATASGFGSFTFQPPVFRGLHGAGMGASACNSSLMICQPFQLPDFFSRDSRATGSAPGANPSATGAGMSSSSFPEGMAAPGTPLRPSGMQHQLSDSLDGLRLAEGSFSVNLDAAGLAPSSPPGATRQLQHSFSMPARFSAPDSANDALAAAAATAAAAGGGACNELNNRTTRALSQQQQDQQQQPELQHAVPYGEVFRSLWGAPSAAPSGSQQTRS